MLCVEWPLAANLKVGRHWAPTDYNFVFSFAHEFQLINVPDLNGVNWRKRTESVLLSGKICWCLRCQCGNY